MFEHRHSFGRGPRHVGGPQATRRDVTGKRDCITGYHPSAKAAMNYRMVTFEGNLAGDYLLILDLDPDILSYEEEPLSFIWFDPISDRRASYTPDFAVHHKNGSIDCVEVRPRIALRELTEPRVVEERTLGAKNAGYTAYKIVTENQIDPFDLRMLNYWLGVAIFKSKINSFDQYAVLYPVFPKIFQFATRKQKQGSVANPIKRLSN